MIELIFVIVVIGIITAAMLPRIDRDNVYEAAQQVVSHIKYTQHLAMIDNKYDAADINIPNPGDGWFQEMWQIRFQACAGNKHAYSIYSDTDHDAAIDASEAALDPLSKKRIDATVCVAGPNQDPNVVLSNKYNIDTINLTGPCFATNNYIAFDHLGRPHIDFANSVNVAQAACTITLASNAENLTISVEPETGYACIINPSTGNCF
jgi:type II secretory pathway pseudopilin PulG